MSVMGVGPLQEPFGFLGNNLTKSISDPTQWSSQGEKERQRGGIRSPLPIWRNPEQSLVIGLKRE